ncbi:TPA: hypothetical protein ACGOZW_002175 [Streptococcus suis]
MEEEEVRWKGGKVERWKGGKVERWKGGRMKAKIIFIVSNFNAFALFSCLFFPKVAQEVAITYISLSQLIVIGYLFWDDE